ncbi:MAG: hypothetical protein ABI675_17675 [Chitinophagaceae bacterium]
MSQTFSHWFMVMGFKLNQDYIAKNICENRYRPKLNCNGNCVLMKKLKQQEREEQNSPVTLKLDLATVIISSRSFFANINFPAVFIAKSYLPLFNTGNPVARAIPIFHPPAA